MPLPTLSRKLRLSQEEKALRHCSPLSQALLRRTPYYLAEGDGHYLAEGDGYYLAKGDGYYLAKGDGYYLAEGDGYYLAEGDGFSESVVSLL